MKRIGYLLLAAGFLGGAYSTALDVSATNWTLFVPAAIVALVGLLMARSGARKAARDDSLLRHNQSELESSLAAVIAGVADIRSRRSSIDTENLRVEIDERLREDLRRFTDARESLKHLYGVQAYADVMSAFAAGERMVNRAWSSSADGYGNEADASLETARARFDEAELQLKRVSGGSQAGATT